MKKQYTRYEEIKELIILMPLLKDLSSVLRADLERIKRYSGSIKDDVIDSIMFAQQISDMPLANTNEASDKTGNAAVTSSIISEKMASSEIEEIVQEIYIVDTIIEKIERGFRTLPETTQEILKLKFWESKTWAEITSSLKGVEIYYSNRQLGEEVRKAIEKINIIAMLESEFYTKAKYLTSRAK